MATSLQPVTRRVSRASRARGVKAGQLVASDAPRPSPHPPLSRASELLLLQHAEGLIGDDELALLLYHAALSLRDVSQLIERLAPRRWNLHLLPSLAEAARLDLETWQQRPLRSDQPLLYFAATALLPATVHAEAPSDVLVAVGINEQGYREVLGVVAGLAEEPSGWERLLADLARRGVRQVRLAVGDNTLPLTRALAALRPGPRFQMCLPGFRRQLVRMLSATHLAEVDASLRRILPSPQAADLAALVTHLERLGETAAAAYVRRSLAGFADNLERLGPLLRYLAATTWLQRSLRQFRLCARPMLDLRSAEDATLFAWARLRHASRTAWAQKRFLSPETAAQF